MNEDFSDAINKFKDILASKNIDLSKLSGALGEKKTGEKSSQPDFDFDIETIIKLKNILSSAKNQNSPKVKLLEDLKPFLNPEAKRNLDELIKLTKILSLLELFSKNGGLNLFNL
ncbi:MAG: hypothetical protein IKM97_02930 [Clostridia bacterium]|nr:hypothetical protein [Clostridia bacterium]